MASGQASSSRHSTCTTPPRGAASASVRSAAVVSSRRSKARASSSGASSQAVTCRLPRTVFHTPSARSSCHERHSRSTNQHVPCGEAGSARNAGS